ncbi:MAG: RimK/LysX family protein [Pseudomonadota bacterium]
MALVAGFALVVGCGVLRPEEAAPQAEGELMELQIRMRLLQSELLDLREALHERTRAQAASANTLEERMSGLQLRLEELPDEISGLCPEVPDAATVTTRCEPSAEVQRVVVSGDKLVVGDLERVWLEPPGVTLEARMDAGAAASALRADGIVELERDGDKWVRFDVVTDGDAQSVERPIEGYARAPGEGQGNRRPVVTLRVRIGDVRETVELTLTSESDADHAMTLGRNFLTDVALVEVGERFVQPAVRSAGE